MGRTVSCCLCNKVVSIYRVVWPGHQPRFLGFKCALLTRLSTFFARPSLTVFFLSFLFFFFFLLFFAPHEGSFSSSLTTFSVSLLFRLFCFCYFCFSFSSSGRPRLIASTLSPPLSLSPKRFAELRTGSIFCFD